MCITQSCMCDVAGQITALMCAAVGGHTEVVQLLLSRQDVNINMRDKVIIINLYSSVYIQPVMY